MCRTYGARNNHVLRTQSLRTGLTSAAPPALGWDRLPTGREGRRPLFEERASCGGVGLSRFRHWVRQASPYESESKLSHSIFATELLCRGLVGRLWRGIRLVVWRRGTSGLCRLRGWGWGRGSGDGRHLGSRRRGRVGPILQLREGA